jgi:hypothetical protein
MAIYEKNNKTLKSYGFNNRSEKMKVEDFNMEKNNKPEAKNNKPEAKFKAGAISATVWARDVEIKERKVTFYNISVTKCIKVDDEFKNISTFDTNDLPKVSMVCLKAYEYVTTKTKVTENDD